eukprot:m.1670199 g.1670199  ORF g.1670199 m.1670199 type:complete len:52 (+) comp164322_c0_seq1:77-232(+)
MIPHKTALKSSKFPDTFWIFVDHVMSDADTVKVCTEQPPMFYCRQLAFYGS